MKASSAALSLHSIWGIYKLPCGRYRIGLVEAFPLKETIEDVMAFIERNKIQHYKIHDVDGLVVTHVLYGKKV